jgi:plasmid maintenance system antidote protein VapI
MPKKSVPPSRFGRLLRKHLVDLIGEVESVKSVAARLGISQGHLSDQVNGKKRTTLDVLDAVARLRGRSATQVLIAIRDIAADLDRDEPGWDSPTDTVADHLGLNGQPRETR